MGLHRQAVVEMPPRSLTRPTLRKRKETSQVEGKRITLETSDPQSKLDLLLAENQQLREWITNQKLATKQWYAFLGLVVLLSVIFTLSYDFVIDNPEYPVGLWVGFLLTIGVWHGLSLRSFLERWKRT